MTTQTFNCTGAGTSITPLKRPYYCCGWALPPLSFSGTWICHKTGSPPFGCTETGVDGVAFKFELESECIYNLLPGNNPYFRYIEVLGNTPDLSGSYLLIGLTLCSSPDGTGNFDGTWQLYNPPVSAGSPTVVKDCSYNVTTKVGYFYYENSSYYDDGMGNTLTTSIVVDTVELP